MSGQKFLLIDEDAENAALIKDSLEKTSDHSLQVVHDSGEALSVLMGGARYRGERYGKGRPDIILLDSHFLDTQGKEFLEVVKKYYSLKNIQIYVVGNAADFEKNPIIDQFGIAGFVTAGTIATRFTESASITPGSSAAGNSLFSFSFFGISDSFKPIIEFIKTKSAVVHAGQAFTAKVTVAAATTIIAGAVITNSIPDSPEERPVVVKEQVSSVHNKPVPAPIPEPKADESIEQQLPEKLITKTPERAIQQEHIVADTVRVAETFPIVNQPSEINTREYKISVMADADTTVSGF